MKNETILARNGENKTRRTNGQMAFLIREMSSLSNELASGNLTSRMKTDGLSVEYSQIINSVNEMLDMMTNSLHAAERKVDYLNNIPTPIIVIDKNFEVTFINKGGATVLKRSVEECIGKKCYNLLDTPHCNTPECRCKQAMERDGVFIGETIARGIGNLPIQYTASPLKDSDGKIIGALEYVIDFTETRKAIDDAQEKVKYLNNIPTPVVVMDRNYEVIFINESGAKVIGRAVGDCIGKKCYHLFDTSHCNTPECRCRQAMERDGVFTGETVAKGAGNLPIQYTGAPLKDTNGKIVGAVEYVADITLLKKQQEALIKTAKQVKAASGNVASAAEEISAATEQIKKGAQSQASAAEETSSTMEEMAAQIQAVANNAEGLASNVEETTTSIQQLGTTSEGVAKKAEAMAANVSETSATIEQMITTIEKTSKNVAKADELSQRAYQEAKKGSEAVIKAIDGMKAIGDTMRDIARMIQGLGERSESIGNIVEVIEEIADQTNLLALNAAIEAARAGDAGRGFAVVADEVRKLAERSMKATKEIGDVIKDVQKDTNNAVKVTEEGAKKSQEVIAMADQAGDGIKQILESVSATSNIMKDISQAAAEQSTAAKNVLTAVEEMNKLTQSVTQATKEQAMGVAQVVKAAENMARMTEQVKNATAEQKKGGENVVKAVENITDIAKSNLGAVEQLTRSAKDLSQQAEKLLEVVQEFQLE